MRRWVLIALLLLGTEAQAFLMPGARAVPGAQNRRYIPDRSAGSMFIPAATQYTGFGSNVTSSMTLSPANTPFCFRFIPPYTLANARNLAWRVAAGQAAASCSMCIYNGTNTGAPLLHAIYTAPACTVGSGTRTATVPAFTLFSGSPYTVCWISNVGGVTIEAANTANATILNQYVLRQFSTATSGSTGACPANIPGTPVSSTAMPPIGLVSAE